VCKKIRVKSLVCRKRSGRSSKGDLYSFDLFGCKSKGRFTRLQKRSIGSSKGKCYSFVNKEKRSCG